MNEPRDDGLLHGLETMTESIVETVADTLQDIKPKLRGWLHAALTPLVISAGTVLIVLSPNALARVGSAIFVASALLLFGVSAVYHSGTWSPRVKRVLQDLDHANIFLLIAGSYTPFALLLIDGAQRWVLLGVVWGGALAGVFLRFFWKGAPRWLSAPIYIALGWVSVFFMPALFSGATDLGLGVGIAIFTLIAVGGLLYTFGGVVYGFKRPNPWPYTFGFHEVFHTFTILAFTSHYVGVSMATYATR